MELKVLLGWFVVVMVNFRGCESANHSMVLGVILHDDDYETKVAVTYAIRKLNMLSSQDFDRHGQRTRQKSGQITYLPDIRTVAKHDSFKTGKVACSLLSSGVSAIFGPPTLPSTGIVRSICSSHEIPHIQTAWSPVETHSQTVLNIHPDPRALSKALAHLVRASHWKTYTVLYQSDEGLVRLQDVLKISRKENKPIIVRQIGEGNDYRPLLKEIRASTINNILLDCSVDYIIPVLTQAKEVGLLEDYQSYILTSLDAHTLDYGTLFDSHPNITGPCGRRGRRGRGCSLRLSHCRPLLKEIRASTINNILLDCSVDYIIPVLTQAKEVGLLEDYQSYILTSLDAHTLDYGTLFDSHPNITTMRFVDPNTQDVQQAVGDWAMWEEREEGKRLQLEAKSLQLKTALMYDAVNLFAAAVKDLHLTSPIKMRKFDCDDETPRQWESGYPIINYMKVKHTPSGLTGPVKFDALGKRTEFDLQVVELTLNNQTVTGAVSAQEGYKSLRSDSELQMQIETSIQTKTFIVSSRIGPPYLRDRIPKKGEVLEGNDRYEGYSMDLIDGISKILNFTYRFELAPDGRYGSFNKKTREWDGLIKQLLLRKADLAICDLTITYERRTAVDFTMPFMTLGVSILYSKQVKEPPNLFSFTSPLSTDVWLYMATAFLGVSFLMYVLARMSPSDWENPHPCDQNPEELENAWDFKNCLWFTLGGIMAQGCDILPKGISTRMLSGMWWFFSLILLSSYTANLAAFLTMERMGPTIESAEDLAKQSKIKYGGVDGGSTLEFFKQSNFSTYQRMWAAMESARPSVFTKNNQEGVERVQKGKKGYAFLMESTSIEYEVEKNCELVQVGTMLDSKGYGIAMPVNSPYRTAISGAVLKMQERGTLYMLKEKWWKTMQTVRCQHEAKAGAESANELDLDNVGGVFVVLFGGMGIAFLIAMLEFLWNVRKVAVDEQMTLCEALIVELKFALNIFITKKSAKPKLSEPSSDNNSETRSIAHSVLRQAGSFLHLDVFNNDITNKINNKKQSH